MESLNVSEILMNVLPNSSNPRVSFPLSQMNALLDIPLARSHLKNHPTSSNHSLNYSPNSSIFVVPPNSPPRNQDLILWNSDTSSLESSPSREAIELEIERLRLQNDEIESKIFNLNSEISDLRVVESMQEEECWKEHLPFLNKEGTLGVFLTKLHIKDYDFDKIDYEQARSELVYDRFTFFLDHRPEKEMKLASILEVRYLGDRRMRIEFKDEETTFLYL
jgi:hypothetical protein